MTGQAQLFDLAEGRRRRDEGVHKVTMAAVEDPWWTNAQRAIRALCDYGAPFSSNEVRAYCGDPPRANAMGALFRWAKQAGLIEFKGELARADHAAGHARVTLLWHPVRSA